MKQLVPAEPLDAEPAIHWAIVLASAVCGLGFTALVLFLIACAAAWLGLVELPLP